MGIGGSLFVRNAIQFDYCIAESIASLMDFCSEVVVMDCCSNDGTTELLKKCRDKYGEKMKLVTDQVWEVGTKYDRLAIQANKAKSYLTTPWHFMLQADEVVHEKSIPAIKRAVESGSGSFMVTRANLFKDMNHCVRFDLEQNKKPCNDKPVRLARTPFEVMGDAESIDTRELSCQFADEILMVHYGLVRKGPALLDKCIDMQSWFWGQGSTPDKRLVAMKNKDNVFRPEQIMPDSYLQEIGFTHPKYAKDWVAERSV